MRAAKDCPHCERSNVAGCNLGKNIYSDHPCFDFIRKEEKQMEASRYYVFNPKAGAPKVHHATIELAEIEAKRIADLEVDTEILVLRAVFGVTCPSTKFIYKRYKK